MLKKSFSENRLLIIFLIIKIGITKKLKVSELSYSCPYDYSIESLNYNLKKIILISIIFAIYFARLNTIGPLSTKRVKIVCYKCISLSLFQQMFAVLCLLFFNKNWILLMLFLLIFVFWIFNLDFNGTRSLHASR